MTLTCKVISLARTNSLLAHGVRERGRRCSWRVAGACSAGQQRPPQTRTYALPHGETETVGQNSGLRSFIVHTPAVTRYFEKHSPQPGGGVGVLAYYPDESKVPETKHRSTFGLVSCRGMVQAVPRASNWATGPRPG